MTTLKKPLRPVSKSALIPAEMGIHAHSSHWFSDRGVAFAGI
jgi:hypothetical protein